MTIRWHSKRRRGALEHPKGKRRLSRQPIAVLDTPPQIFNLRPQADRRIGRTNESPRLSRRERADRVAVLFYDLGLRSRFRLRRSTSSVGCHQRRECSSLTTSGPCPDEFRQRRRAPRSPHEVEVCPDRVWVESSASARFDYRSLHKTSEEGFDLSISMASHPRHRRWSNPQRPVGRTWVC